MNPLHQAVMLLLIPLLVSTKHMIADIFTKAVDTGSFILFRDIIMNNNACPFGRHSRPQPVDYTAKPVDSLANWLRDFKNFQDQ